MATDAHATRTSRIGRLALLPVILTFGGVLWLESSAQVWLSSGDKPIDGQQVAGVATERDAVWDLVESSGREPETVWVNPFLATQPDVAVQAAGVVLNERDLVKAWPETDWGWGGEARIYRAQQIAVIDSGKKRLLFSWQATVADVLTEYGIELGEQDQISPSLTTRVQTSDATHPFTISITRVLETKVIVKESIPVETTYKDDPTSEKGTEKIVEVGSAGVKAKTYLVRREDGEEVKRTLLSTDIEKAMKKKVILRGTKVVVIGTGQATWYPSARAMSASHNSLPRWSKVRVVNTQNGKSVVVTIEGGGVQGATIDLTKDAFALIGNLGAGRIPVRIEKYYE